MRNNTVLRWNKWNVASNMTVMMISWLVLMVRLRTVCTFLRRWCVKHITYVRNLFWTASAWVVEVNVCSRTREAWTGLCGADPHRASPPTLKGRPADLQHTRTLCGLSHMALTEDILTHTLIWSPAVRFLCSFTLLQSDTTRFCFCSPWPPCSDVNSEGSSEQCYWMFSE